MVKIKKGFKVDRIKARRDPANLRKNKRGGKKDDNKQGTVNVSTGTGAAARPKIIKFDTESMKDYITGFHQRKNQRRMYAIKKAKEEHRATVNTERKQKRESRRQMYNNLSQFPINEDFKLTMPGDENSDESGDEDFGGTHRQTYTGAQDDTVVDVEVEALDLGGPTGTTRTHAAADSSSDEESEEPENPNQFPSGKSSNPFAFPSSGTPAKVRLIRKRK
eukprot:TRINITY_DN1573_c0_g1_i1.p1 TRINITY_DN1573_c0_g1~~TRINITY_DN1573_c0_g1_i1.p1  ORF type:complete len:235 (+),score=51.07 TRINITY_DN1573_c0_g1_i1:46-705(+)